MNKTLRLYSQILRLSTANIDDMVRFQCISEFDLLTNMLDVTTSIISFVIEVVSTHSALLDSHVILHAALVSSLHRTIGAEFGKDTLYIMHCD